MKTTFESFVFGFTNSVIIFGLLAMFTGFLGGEVMMNEDLLTIAIQVLDWVNLLFACCIVLGWVAALRYFKKKEKEPNTRADWILLFCGLLVPPSAIYILRYLRKRDGKTSEAPEKNSLSVN